MKFFNILFFMYLLQVCFYFFVFFLLINQEHILLSRPDQGKESVDVLCQRDNIATVHIHP